MVVKLCMREINRIVSELVEEEVQYVEKAFQVILNKPTVKFQLENQMHQSLLHANSRIESYLSVGKKNF
jgi:hypothetical protein